MMTLPLITNRREGESGATGSDSAAGWMHGAGAPLRLPSTCKALVHGPRPWDPALALSRVEVVAPLGSHGRWSLR